MTSVQRQTVDRMFDAFKHQNVADAVATVSDDTVWIHHGTQKLPSMRFKGRNGVRQFFETNFTQMNVAHFRVLQIIEQGDTVIALGEEQFTMPGVPGDLAQKWVQVYTLKNGLISRMEEFATSAAPEQYTTVG